MWRRRLAAIGLLLLFSSGCFDQSQSTTTNSGYPIGEIHFKDDAPANTTVAESITSLIFTRPEGGEVSLQDFVKEKTVVLVVTRGNTNPICPYCSTQTARLISAYDDFVERGVEIVVVYPVESAAHSQALDKFLASSLEKLSDPNRPVPFPVLLDVELHAIDQLGIRKNLSKPATYIIDRTGEVRYAYVGNHLADRPSVQALLKQLDQLSGAAGDATASAAQ
jgi:peroxiredoxin